jgi:hemerythrin
MQQFNRLVWEPKYTVHVEELDAQHQKLFNITNNVLDLYENGSGELYPSLQNLVEYLCTHIRCENSVMINYDYPGYAEQNSQHSKFLDKMQDFLNSYKENDKDLTFKILSYLHHWIYSHTVVMDLQYGQYIISTRPKIK